MSTDWHFGKSHGRFDKIIYDGIKAQCEHARQNNIKVMIHLGDILDVKQAVSTSTLNFIAKSFRLMNDTYDKIYLLVGNHDMSKRTYDSTGHNLHILDGFPNVILVDEPTICKIMDKDFYFLPYLPFEKMKTHIFPKADYMCGHIEVQGFMLNQFVKAEEGVDRNIITKQYDHVFLGHFHKRQLNKNLSYIGSLCRFFYGEDDDERGWTVLDVQSGNSEFIEYDHPRMYKFKASALVVEEDLSSVFKPGDNLKLVIDMGLKYSELEELKSKLILVYKINELVLDDQYFTWIEMEDLDDDAEGDEESKDDKIQEHKSFIDYVLDEMVKINKDDDIENRESIKFLRELSKQYQD